MAAVMSPGAPHEVLEVKAHDLTLTLTQAAKEVQGMRLPVWQLMCDALAHLQCLKVCTHLTGALPRSTSSAGGQLSRTAPRETPAPCGEGRQRPHRRPALQGSCASPLNLRRTKVHAWQSTAAAALHSITVTPLARCHAAHGCNRSSRTPVPCDGWAAMRLARHWFLTC